MTTFELQGRITENGNLEIQLPAGLPAGEVTVRIDVPDSASDWENQLWTEEELHELMAPEPKTGAEIAAMLEKMEPIELVDPEITDPSEWVEAQRRKEGSRLKSYWDGEK
jgi:hypothetical protein